MVKTFKTTMVMINIIKEENIKDYDRILVNALDFKIEWWKGHTVNIISNTTGKDIYCCNIGDFSKNKATLEEFKQYCMKLEENNFDYNL